MQDFPLTRDLVLIGGGHSHALILKRWGMTPLPGVRLTLINPGSIAAYSGMLPGFVAGHYLREALEIDLLRLARHAGARFISGRVEAIDREGRCIHVAGRPPIAYDVASIDIGITSDMPELPGFADHGVAAKPLEQFAAHWDRFRTEARQGAVRAEVAVIGGGVAGAELAMAMAHALKASPTRQVSLIDRGDILGEMRPATRKALLQALSKTGVQLMPDSPVQAVDAGGVLLSDDHRIAAQLVVGAAGARPQDWLSETGLEVHEGFLAVGPTLQTSDPDIFAVGDCAHLSHAPRPKAGVFAVREAPVLFNNLRARLAARTGDIALRRYQPQKDYLKLISLGDREALADKAGLRHAGPFMWRWKDRIDRRFMDRFRELRPMQPPSLPTPAAAGLKEEIVGQKPLCGACGAKVGGDILGRVLQGSHTATRSDVLHLAGDDAALLTHGDIWQVASVDHLRAFVEDPVLMTRITAIHALGDVWAMGAAPQAALATVTLPRLSPALQERWLHEIMDTAQTVFGAEGAEIIGGHTAMGAELSIGFTVTGLLDSPITLKGARPGDRLLLTKPIGTGVLLAADMAMTASGRDLEAAYASMSQSSGPAARILSHAHAMTDVTGFGLAGHLLGICRASQVGARLRLSQVPFLSGAQAQAQSGVRSTLFSANRGYANRYSGPDSPAADLLFDPQTAGGLLAAVSPSRAEKCLTALQEAGYRAACIGEITDETGMLTVFD